MYCFLFSLVFVIFRSIFVLVSVCILFTQSSSFFCLTASLLQKKIAPEKIVSQVNSIVANSKTLRPTHKTTFSIFPIFEHCSPIQDKKQLKCGQLHPLVGTRLGKRLDELDSETGEWIPGNELGEDWQYFVLLIFSLSLRGEMSDPSVCLSLTIDNWVDKLTGYTFRSMADNLCNL